MAENDEVGSSQPLLLQLLAERGTLDAEKLEILRQAQFKDHGPLESVLVRFALAGDQEIANVYAEHLAIPLVPEFSEGFEIDAALADLLPEKLCRDLMLVPLARHGDGLEVAFASAEHTLIMDELQLVTGLTIQPLIGRLDEVMLLIDLLYCEGQSRKGYAGGNDDFAAVEEDVREDGDPFRDDEILDLDLAPPPGRDGRIIRMVNQILEQALTVGASDIHLEPFEDSCAIRLRIDGVLHELSPPSRTLFVPIISRFKILAKMDIAEKRIPQDGAIAVKSADKRVDLRVSTVPTVYGEKMVMRILDKGAIPLQLTGLGFDQRQSNDLVESIRMPHGLMLVTGPTGSGKSTTLYACLSLLNEPDTNICTVEDPVEYKFKGMNQVQVKAQVGLTFASALRAFLRQDPDVIMVGEVRDPETAGICLRAALTGHFVLSTIHTNDALSAVSRLQDMGIEPFLLASTLRVLEAQRLIRRICKECREPYAIDAATAQLHSLAPGETFYRSKGCDHCKGTGYRGRVGVFEVVRITPRMAQLIQTRTPLPELRAAAREEGMKLLIDSGLDKARQGMTSLEEVLTVTTSED
jgi:type IV pilus assembly protein PilB